MAGGSSRSPYECTPLKVVEKKERIKIFDIPEAENSPQVNLCPFDHRPSTDHFF
jgi:hypothetical protein